MKILIGFFIIYEPFPDAQERLAHEGWQGKMRGCLELAYFYSMGSLGLFPHSPQDPR